MDLLLGKKTSFRISVKGGKSKVLPRDNVCLQTKLLNANGRSTHISVEIYKARLRRQTFHLANLMLMSKSLCLS